MDTVSRFSSGLNSTADRFLAPQLDNKVVGGLVWLVLILYGGLVAPHLPNPMLKMFDWVPFRILFLSVIGWAAANEDPATAIMLAVIFYVSINTLNGKKPFEKFGVHKELM